MSVAGAYARFRGGKAFLITLAALLAFWIIWNLLPFLPHFDGPQFGRLNLFLSSEASLSVALLIMANEKQEAAQRKQLEYMMHLMTAIRDQLAKEAGHEKDRGS